MKTPSCVYYRWFYRSFNAVLLLKKYQSFLIFLNPEMALTLTQQKISKDTKIFIPKVIFTSQTFKIKICNILEKHDIRKKSIKLFYRKNVP